MDTGKTQVAYKKGDVYLCARYGNEMAFQEVEIIDVAQAAKAVKTDADGWIDAAKFHATVRGKLGRAEYHGWWLTSRRTVVRT